MSFTDPLKVTIAPNPEVNLPRVSVGDDKSEYMASDGLIRVEASHNYGKRTRRMLRLDTSKLAPDPFRPAENVKLSMSTYIVFDLPPAGYNVNEAYATFMGFYGLFGASSFGMISKLLGGES